jgi:hypothetical protein
MLTKAVLFWEPPGGQALHDKELAQDSQSRKPLGNSQENKGNELWDSFGYCSFHEMNDYWDHQHTHNQAIT